LTRIKSTFLNETMVHLALSDKLDVPLVAS